jgi:hypothetical protein
MNAKINFFGERIRYFGDQTERLKSRSRVISTLRIFTFLIFITALIVFLNLKLLVPVIALVVVFIFIFGSLVKWHNTLKDKLSLNDKIYKINQEEINRLNFRYDDFHDWKEFSNEKHEYSGDLDLYGKNSLFQLINRAETPHGIQNLKKWLENPAPADVIAIRQEAAKELAPLVDWRQKIQAQGRRKVNEDQNEKAFYEWLNGEDRISNNPFYKILPYLIIPVSSALLILLSLQMVPLYFFFIPVVISGVFILRMLDYSKSTYLMTTSGVLLLQSIEQVLMLIEEHEFKHKHLSNLRSVFLDKELKASQKIQKLRQILDFFNSRSNQFYQMLNSVFLLDYLLLAKAESWRKKHNSDINHWFNAIAEIESLNSIAAFTFANDNYVFPTISEKHFVFSAENLGHPLIPDGKRVHNDFDMDGRGGIVIVTGSNMAGKSTFLRTVGINAVLAFCGAPVCAESLSLSIFQVFTSMRTKDNLEENISSFYAELLRLKMLLENINNERPVLFLLDEILKGTNSTDRHIGAESLARQLSKMNAFGIISTHDLKLGELKLESGKPKNCNFSSSINGEEIVFDYKLRDGICESTNASQLMAKIGIKISM